MSTSHTVNSVGVATSVAHGSILYSKLMPHGLPLAPMLALDLYWFWVTFSPVCPTQSRSRGLRHRPSAYQFHLPAYRRRRGICTGGRRCHRRRLAATPCMASTTTNTTASHSLPLKTPTMSPFIAQRRSHRPTRGGATTTAGAFVALGGP